MSSIERGQSYSPVREMVDAKIKQFEDISTDKINPNGWIITGFIIETIDKLPDRFIYGKFTPIKLFTWKEAWFDVLEQAKYPEIVAEDSTHMDLLYGEMTSPFLIDRFERWMIQERADNETHLRIARMDNKAQKQSILLPSLGWTPEDYTNPNSKNGDPFPFYEVFKRKPDEFCPHRPSVIK